MRFRRKPRLAILFLLCLSIFSSAAFAQANGNIKSEIYSKLKCCACEVSFEKCVCPEAKEMKAYIEALLESGASREDIFYRVAKKFSLDTILDEKIKDDVREKIIKESGQTRPQIILEPASFNFGKVSKKQGKIIKVFKLYNKGSTELIITNIRVSCSCVTASLKVGKNKSPYFGMAGAGSSWKQEVAAGGSGELEVILDLTHPSMAPGKEVRDIFVASNDPVYPQLTLRVELEVTE